jgi:DNA-directed RNA polymerase specialized sigma24 family protein
MVCDDEQRVQRFLSGDQEAFREIVDVYKAYVFAIILNFVKQQDEAENVVQEVFMQIYRSLPQYRFQSFKSWIGKISITKAIDWQRYDC